ncbi:MAG: hypothetical protein M1334_04175 [Patescibacteria group bacterium]|nr:hypothetical protein [Patescibacteria group bacterium]
MIYKLTLIESQDNFIKETYRQSMKELSNFYGINWIMNTPKIILLKDRKSINLLRVKKTEPWLVGWADERMRIIFMLGKKNFNKESSNKYSDEYYSSLIKHELSHLFYRILSSSKSGPIWLSEGVAIYTSGQTKLKARPKKFNNFLSFYNQGGSGVYAESGFVVEMLVKKFGKNKMLKLIKSLRDISGDKQFNGAFRKIYGFTLNYKEINKRYLK